MQTLERRSLCCAILALAALLHLPKASAASFYIQYYFVGLDGSTPLSDVLLVNGVVYGTTLGGGDFNNGTVFSFDPNSGIQTVLHSFQGGPADGAGPIGALTQDAGGNLYGTTSGGGAYVLGTVFKISARGELTILHSFQGHPVEGSGPSGTLVIDRNGNLYGTTFGGGITALSGSLFEITAAGTYIGSQQCPYGTLPRGGLLLLNGHLYGTTSGGQLPPGVGKIFQVGVATPLYSFTGNGDGSEPMAALIGDRHGNLYGTACTGGSGQFGMGHGVVFRFNLSTQQLTPIHTFRGSDGTCPMGRLAADTSGNLYGTTMYGGQTNNGTVFVLNDSGLTVLHHFTGGPFGANPVSGVTLDADGNLWGVASTGGFGYGLIYEISPN